MCSEGGITLVLRIDDSVDPPQRASERIASSPSCKCSPHDDLESRCAPSLPHLTATHKAQAHISTRALNREDQEPPARCYGNRVIAVPDRFPRHRVSDHVPSPLSCTLERCTKLPIPTRFAPLVAGTSFLLGPSVQSRHPVP